MHPVGKAVVQLYGHPQPFAAVFLPISAPGQSRNGVIPVHVPLVCKPRQLHPGQAGEIDQIQPALAFVDKAGLAAAFFPAAAQKAAMLSSMGRVTI